MNSINSSSDVFQLTTSSFHTSLHRIALDQSADIGSLYNALKDSIHGRLFIDITPKYKVLQETKCFVEKGDILTKKNLLEMIEMDGEQRLSLILNMISIEKISSLLIRSILVNKYTRIFYYCYSYKSNYISDDANNITADIPIDIPEKSVTHVITGIKLGIHLLITFQLSPTNTIYFDDLLRKIKNQLIDGIFEITEDEKDSLDQITSTKVFSNIPELVQMTKLTDIFEEIIIMKQSHSHYCPIEYTLRSIKWLYPSHSTENKAYSPLDKASIDKIEQYLLELTRSIKPLLITFDPPVKTLLNKHHLYQLFEKLQPDINEIKKFYSAQINCLSHSVEDIRSGKEEQKIIDDILTNEQTSVWKNKIKIITDCLNDLLDKIHFIQRLEKKNIGYLNMEQLIKQNDDDLSIIMQKIFRTQEEYLVYCLNDDLKKQVPTTWDIIYQNLIKQRKNHCQIHFIYADFSYCLFSLTKMRLFSSNHKELQLLSTFPDPALSILEEVKQPSSVQSDSLSVNYINVLLLGESGVGKSTFINAFVNYLVFQNLDEAHLHKPIILIPVSFLMTIGEHFEERLVQFGEKDSNEDHYHPGQSVTQQCKSYLFDIDNQTKLRLIDTPGMGDTRGLDQDDQNIRHILSFINNLEHLNGICILLKPNQSRLNIVFRSYFDRLLTFLGSNARHNIIFCFTNTRSTFYSPGDTAPLLRTMIQSHQIKDIPFEKLNTFCFDSESFRYLIALENGISFDHYQEQEFRQSWIKSVPESIRMFKYICKTLKSYPDNQWRSIEHAQFQIIQFIRPLLETIRNIHRNLILLDQSTMNSMIKLCPKPCSQFSAVCTQCKRSAKLYADFWIIPDDCHIFRDTCNKCQHRFSKHIIIDYQLDYEISNDEDDQSINEMESILHRIKNALPGFARFFAAIVSASDQIDPILSVLNRMIDEEDSICSYTKSNHLNLKLSSKLKDLKEKYEQTRKKALFYQKGIDLNHIYTLIKDISRIKMINKQIKIIKQFHRKYIEEHQIQIPHC